jgi:hypothetical protein
LAGEDGQPDRDQRQPGNGGSWQPDHRGRRDDEPQDRELWRQKALKAKFTDDEGDAKIAATNTAGTATTGISTAPTTDEFNTDQFNTELRGR